MTRFSWGLTLFGIEGGAGNDRINGGAGDDVLRGKSGADFLVGQEGDDVLLGSAGGDTLTALLGGHVQLVAANPSSAARLVKTGQVRAIAGDRLPARFARRLDRWRYGAGVFKVDWALSGPVPWAVPEARQSAVVHVGDSIDDLHVALALGGLTVAGAAALSASGSITDDGGALRLGESRLGGLQVELDLPLAES